jgi:ribose transport system ATP-binding protein
VTAAALRVEGVSKRFGGTPALDGVTFEVRPHEVVGLVGENGAGKSTLLKVLAGLITPDAGRIILRGQAVRLRSVVEAANAGIGMVFQEQSLVTNVSVAENILLGHEGTGVRLGVFYWQRLHALAQTQLDKLGATISPAAATDSLSFAERQMVELAKVLAIEERTRHEPIILLDEPTSVLDADEIETVLRQVERLRERASVVFVSHRLEEVLRVSDRVYVMTNGQCVAERDPRSCAVDELQRLMLGHALRAEYGRREAATSAASAPVRLAVQELSRRGEYTGISFALHPGEILGIAGVQGSGRESLCRTLFGTEAPDGGTILLDGRPLTLGSPADAVAHGIGYVPAERRTEGIIGGMSVGANMTLAHLAEFRRGFGIDRRRERSVVGHWIEQLRIRTPSPATRAADLSGGNQQKLVLAKWLIGQQPSVLILDHPLRGLDVGAKAEIFAAIGALARGGIGIVLIADTLDELIALSDTVIVMRDGRISARFSVAEDRPTQLAILEKMV